MDYLPRNIKYLREKFNMSQNALAKRVNVNHSTVSRWESGEMSATVGNAYDLSGVFGVSIPDLISKDLSVDSSIEDMLQNKIMDNVRLCTKEEKEQILQIIDVIRKSEKNE